HNVAALPTPKGLLAPPRPRSVGALRTRSGRWCGFVVMPGRGRASLAERGRPRTRPRSSNAWSALGDQVHENQISRSGRGRAWTSGSAERDRINFGSAGVADRAVGGYYGVIGLSGYGTT